jgi:2-oxoglutarate ferredoxin oxidoreductase subunit delta
MRQYTGSKYAIYIDDKFCAGCGICIDFCPFKVLASSPQLNTRGVHEATALSIDKCTGCNICVEFCPDFAIAVEKRGG